MAGTIVADTIQSGVSTPTVFKNTSGTEIGQFVKAWCNYNGGGTTVRGSFNISSVTVVSAGNYTFNFSTSVTDANLSASGIGEWTSAVTNQSIPSVPQGVLPTTSTVRYAISLMGGSATSYTYVSLIVNR